MTFLEVFVDVYCHASVWNEKAPLFRTITNTAGRPLTELDQAGFPVRLRWLASPAGAVAAGDLRGLPGA